MKDDLSQYAHNERFAKMTTKKLHSVDTVAYNRQKKQNADLQQKWTKKSSAHKKKVVETEENIISSRDVELRDVAFGRDTNPEIDNRDNITGLLYD